MSIWEILVVAVGLSMDAAAVSLAAGAGNRARGARAAFRLSFHFGLFQFLMPVAGWFVGAGLTRYVQSAGHWIAFVLLLVVGGRTVHAAFSAEDRRAAADPSRGATLIMLAVATSLDAFAVGLTLAMLGTGIWYASFVIGVVTAGLSFVAVTAGRRVGDRFGPRMEAIGGLAIVAVGLKILVQNLR